MKLEELQFFNPRHEIAFSANRLPHWQQQGGTYFVTFRLGDALPQDLLRRWTSERAAWLRIHPLPWSPDEDREYQDRFTGAVERWLDAGHGSCLLRRPDCAAIVREALQHFEGERYEHVCWVIMPNHVHVIFVLAIGQSLERVLHSWKLYAARRINQAVGRTGNLWQRDYFDRLVRDQQHFARCVRYVRKNPEKAKLRPGEYILFESGLARQID